MRLRIMLGVLLLFMVMPARADVLHDLWEKYAAMSIESRATTKQDPAFPGRDKSTQTKDRSGAFYEPWKYRPATYELHYDSQQVLAAAVYGLALNAKDIDKTLDRNVFLNNVLGFHYSVDQICTWIGAVHNNEADPMTAEERTFVKELELDGVLTLRDGRCSGTGAVRHILAVTKGRKRSLEQNLRHERLHVFWDEDQDFRDAARSAWKALSEEQRAEAKQALRQYSQSNEAQLVEEWAIKQAEKTLRNVP